MGLFGKKKRSDRKYKSEEAHDDPDPEYHKRKDPYLVIGNAPRKPMFAGKGLESNTEYQYKRDAQDDSAGLSHPCSASLRKVCSAILGTEAT